MRYLLPLPLIVLFFAHASWAGGGMLPVGDASCELVTLTVVAEDSEEDGGGDFELIKKDYIQCLMRGEAARVVIRESHEAMRTQAVLEYDEEFESSISAWEFYGADLSCAARTSTSEDMATEELILRHLSEAEALCEFFIDPASGKVEVPHRMVPESSTGGVSNNF